MVGLLVPFAWDSAGTFRGFVWSRCVYQGKVSSFKELKALAAAPLCGFVQGTGPSAVDGLTLHMS